MVAAWVGVTIVTIAMNAFVTVADLLRMPFVLENAAAVGVPATWLTPLALLKGAGAVGLLLGLLGVPLIGMAAAVGLVLFFVGAIVFHVRAGEVIPSVVFPGCYLLLAVASLVLGLTVG